MSPMSKCRLRLRCNYTLGSHVSRFLIRPFVFLFFFSVRAESRSRWIANRFVYVFTCSFPSHDMHAMRSVSTNYLLSEALSSTIRFPHAKQQQLKTKKKNAINWKRSRLDKIVMRIYFGSAYVSNYDEWQVAGSSQMSYRVSSIELPFVVLFN